MPSMRWATVPVLVAVVACSQPPSFESSIAGACEPSRAVVDPLIGVEVEATGATEAEGWALIFAAQTRTRPGEGLVFGVDEELKIVWRLTGEGDASFRAIGPDGVVEQLTLGSEGSTRFELGSSWR